MPPGPDAAWKRRDQLAALIEGLTARIRNDPRFTSLPVLAVTSVCGEGAEKHGLAAGVDAYLIKLDQEKLLVSIARYMTCGRAA